MVEPVHVARGTIPEDFPLPSELEAATNGTLANTVRQLSSLSRHAEDLFGELAREAHGLAARANSLQTRIDRLAVKVTQLDSNVEEGMCVIIIIIIIIIITTTTTTTTAAATAPWP
jgi:WAS family protein